MPNVVIQNNQGSWWANMYCFLHTTVQAGYRVINSEVHKVTWIFGHLSYYEGNNPFKSLPVESEKRQLFAYTILKSKITGDLLKLNPVTDVEKIVLKHAVVCIRAPTFKKIYYGILQDTSLCMSVGLVKTLLSQVLDCENYLKHGVIGQINDLHTKMKAVHEKSMQPEDIQDNVLKERFENMFCDLGRYIVNHSTQNIEARALRYRSTYCSSLKESEDAITNYTPKKE